MYLEIHCFSKVFWEFHERKRKKATSVNDWPKFGQIWTKWSKSVVVCNPTWAYKHILGQTWATRYPRNCCGCLVVGSLDCLASLGKCLGGCILLLSLLETALWCRVWVTLPAIILFPRAFHSHSLLSTLLRKEWLLEKELLIFLLKKLFFKNFHTDITTIITRASEWSLSGIAHLRWRKDRLCPLRKQWLALARVVGEVVVEPFPEAHQQELTPQYLSTSASTSCWWVLYIEEGTK